MWRPQRPHPTNPIVLPIVMNVKLQAIKRSRVLAMPPWQDRSRTQYAEEVGFEPTEPVRAHALSRRARSAASVLLRAQVYSRDRS